MLSPPQQTFGLFAPTLRQARSCSALPKSNDHLSWQEAVVLIERSESQSFIQEKISFVQRKLQFLRPPSRSSDRPTRMSQTSTCHRRAHSAFATSVGGRESDRNSNVDPRRLKVEIAGCLPPNDKPDWCHVSAEIANCLPPDHLDPPPGYFQAFSPSQGVHFHQQSRSVVLQTQNDELFFRSNSTPNISSTRTAAYGSPGGTPNAFELEHWARMNDP